VIADCAALLTVTVFVVAAGGGAVITKVNIALIQTSASGVWQTAFGSTTTALASNTNNIALSDPDPTFNNITLTDATNQILLGTGSDITTINSTGSGIFSVILDADANDEFVLRDKTQTLLGKTLDNGFATGIFNTQDITSTGVVAALSITAFGTTDQIALGTGSNVTTISSTGTGLFTVTLDADAADEFVLVNKAQTLFNKVLDTAQAINLFSTDNITSTGTVGAVNLTAENNITASSGTVSGLNITATGLATLNKVVEGVQAYTGSGPHGLTGSGKRVNTVLDASTVELPESPPDGTVFTVINIGTDSVTVSRSGGDFIDDGSTTSLALSLQYQRVTLQYVAGIWYIV
jgi:hypothetical protein